MGEFVKGKHPDIFFSWQDSAQLIWNCGLTFHSHFGSTHPYDRDVYDTFVWGDFGLLDTYVLVTGRPPHLPLGHRGIEGQAAERKS